MNRQQRRTAKATARKAPVDPVTAIHEAGHAVFAVLLGLQEGWPSPNGALEYIEMWPKPSQEILEKGGALGGWTEFAMFSPEMNAYVKPYLQRLVKNNKIQIADLKPAFAEMQDKGIDVRRWLRARLLMSVAGAAAEARFTGKAIDDIYFHGEICRADHESVKRHCHLCALTKDEYAAELEDALTLAEQQVEQPEIWAAIKALATQLKHGRMSGDEAARIIRQSMPEEQVSQP